MLIATTERLDAAELRAAILAVFDAYNTHPLPNAMPTTPPEWARDFRAAAGELGIPALLHDADNIVASLLNSVLTDSARGAWDPTEQRWDDE